MSIARNYNSSTIKVPALSKEQLEAVYSYIKQMAPETVADLNPEMVARETPLVSYGVTATRTVELKGIDEKTAAMIMGVVCDQLKTEPSKLTFKSIKAL